MIEKYEEDISEWYYDHQDNNLHDWLCRNRVLTGKQKSKGLLAAISCNTIACRHELLLNI